MGTILIIEDEVQLATLLRRMLEEAGHTTHHCRTGVEGLRAALDLRPTLVLLDLGLGAGQGGLDVCRQLRGIPAIRDMPVIVLTGQESRQTEADLFAAGADDFVRKRGVTASILMHRIQAVLRRAQAPQDVVLTVGPLRADLVTQQVSASGQDLGLTPTQFRILAHLMRQPGRLVAGDELADGEEGGASTLRVHVLGLRRRLGALEWMIETVRGEGIRLRAEPGDGPLRSDT